MKWKICLAFATSQSTPSPVGAVVHDGYFVEARSLQRNSATFTPARCIVEIRKKRCMHLVSESSLPYCRTRIIYHALGKAPAQGPIVQPRHRSSSKPTKYVQKKNLHGPLPHLNSPPPPIEPSCRTALPLEQGEWNATKPPANACDWIKFNNWKFTSKLF